MKKAQNKKCPRCGKEDYYFEPCMHCKRVICKNCIKSSSNAAKTERRVICKDCWGDKKKQKAFQKPSRAVEVE
ncbi:MAG: hypothetical protein Q8P02_00640 [Candidatus Micrarchaeota archaeon]|nr:hypothetical protein [Candidatus Micrarchaeota archaeon]